MEINKEEKDLVSPKQNGISVHNMTKSTVTSEGLPDQDGDHRWVDMVRISLIRSGLTLFTGVVINHLCQKVTIIILRSALHMFLISKCQESLKFTT